MVTAAATDVPLPYAGQEIRYRRKGKSLWHNGIVARVWSYEYAIIDLVEGGNLIPAFGDKWRAC